MEMRAWLNLIDKMGGPNNIAMFIFDNSRTYNMDLNTPPNERYEVDEENDAWILTKKEQPFVINGKTIVEKFVEANDSLQCITFVTKPEDKKLWRGDV